MKMKSNYYKIDLKDFPIYHNDLDSYVIGVIEYINNNYIPKEYYNNIIPIFKTYFKTKGKYITNSELNRYLNREIKFEDIRDRFEELSQAKNQEEFLRIQNDLM